MIRPRFELYLQLRRAIWNENVSRSVINTALRDQARILERKIKDYMDNSTPSGRLYTKRLGKGTRRLRTQGHSYVGPRKKRDNSRTQYFQASAEGDPPAKLTHSLYRSIKVKQIPGEFRIEASVDFPGAILDDPTRLNRPFFRHIIFGNDGDWNFRQAVKRSISLLLNKEKNAEIRAKRAAAKKSISKSTPVQTRRRETADQKRARILAKFGIKR